MPDTSNLNLIEPQEFACDFALIMASKGVSVTELSLLLRKIETIYPDCVEVVKAHNKKSESVSRRKFSMVKRTYDLVD